MNQLLESQKVNDHNILVVDDDQDTCRLLEALFRMKGYPTKVAFSGQDAVQYVEVSEPDAVVLDIMMPEMDGWETFHQIRSHSDVPVLFLTALASGESAVHAFSIGGNDFLRKPFFPGELIARTEALIRNRNTADSELINEDGRKEIQSILPEVSVVIPAYNEEEGLPLVLRAVLGILDETYEVVVVDDGSTDNTAKVIEAFSCRLIQHPHNRGKGAALRTGLQQAHGKKVIFLDADNTYPVEAIPTLARLLENNDLVRGTRLLNQTNIPLVNRLGNLLFTSIVQLVNLVEGGDILSGMYGGQRDKLLALELESEGFDIEAEICVKAKARGLHCETIPITYNQRVGEKKLNSFRDGLRILYRIMQLAVSFSPLLAFIIPGVALVTTGLVGLGFVQLAQLQILNLPLAMNSLFLIGAIESLGTQLLIFGTAVYEAGMAYGLRGQANRTIDKISRLLSAQMTKMMGALFGTFGLIGIIGISVAWLIHRGPFNQTALLIFLSYCTLIGFQFVSAGTFLSALKGLNRINFDVVNKEKKTLKYPRAKNKRLDRVEQ